MPLNCICFVTPWALAWICPQPPQHKFLQLSVPHKSEAHKHRCVLESQSAKSQASQQKSQRNRQKITEIITKLIFGGAQKNRSAPLGNIQVTTTTKIFPKVVRYEWEAYCNANGRRTAIQMGGVLTVFPFLRA